MRAKRETFSVRASSVSYGSIRGYLESPSRLFRSYSWTRTSCWLCAAGETRKVPYAQAFKCTYRRNRRRKLRTTRHLRSETDPFVESLMDFSVRTRATTARTAQLPWDGDYEGAFSSEFVVGNWIHRRVESTTVNTMVCRVVGMEVERLERTRPRESNARRKRRQLPSSAAPTRFLGWNERSRRAKPLPSLRQRGGLGGAHEAVWRLVRYSPVGATVSGGGVGVG